LDSAATARVEAVIQNVGADVLVVVADQGEVGLAAVEGGEKIARNGAVSSGLRW
jgi:hypothetical protein